MTTNHFDDDEQPGGKLADSFRALTERQEAIERQLNALTTTLKALEARVAELGRPLTPQTVPVPVSAAAAETVAASPAAPGVIPKEEEGVSPEMLVVIAAAVTAFLGKKVRIRSAKMLQSPYEIVNPWSQQGRVFVQASHNLRSRG
jgi:methylmalonyl-CoA carboxyltransferase 12S subunit